MSYHFITIPDGFDAKHSYIKWMVIVEVDNGLGAPGATFHRQVPPHAGNVREVVQPHSKGGIVKLNINMDYKLVKLEDIIGGAKLPKEVESGRFLFGCVWPYTYSRGQLAFGPAQKYTPSGRGFKLLQGSCEEVQSKDQNGTGVRPYAYAAAQLSLKPAPGEPPGWSFQLPFVGGPSYTPPGGRTDTRRRFPAGQFLDRTGGAGTRTQDRDRSAAPPTYADI